MKNRKLFIILSAIVVSSIIAVVWYFSVLLNEGRRNLSSSYLREATIRTRSEFENLFTPAEKTIRLLNQWGRSGLLKTDNISDLNEKLIPVLKEMDRARGITLADSLGNEYYLYREGKAWRVRQVIQENLKRKVLYYNLSAQGKIISSGNLKTDYNPLNNPWFIGAVEANNELFVSRPTAFFTGGEPDITLAMSWRSTDQYKRLNVSAVDFLISDIVHFVVNLEVSPNGEAFLIDEDTHFITDRIDSVGNFVSDSLTFYAKDSTKSDLIASAIKLWQERDKSGKGPFEYKLGKSVCWSEIQPLGKGGIYIGVALPESDISDEFESKKNQIIVILSSIILLTILAVFIIIKKYAKLKRPYSLLDLEDSVFIKEFETLLSKGESRTVEFKSTMRMNLHTGQKGKEIEIAWLKGLVGFMNTDGGTLVIGVDDDGQVLGLKSDAFENEDKIRLHYKNLIGQHIGPEFSRFLRFDIRKVRNQEVIIIEAREAGKPVFLKNKNDEAFYIRSGPSSERLTVSQVLSYTENKKAKKK